MTLRKLIRSCDANACKRYSGFGLCSPVFEHYSPTGTRVLHTLVFQSSVGRATAHQLSVLDVDSPVPQHNGAVVSK